MSLVLSFMTMLPRLTAEDQLSSVRIGQLAGSAQFPLDEVKAQVRAFEDAARPNRRRSRAARPTPEALAAMGIGMVSVPAETGLNHD